MRGASYQKESGINSIEYDDWSKEPLALLELAQDIGQDLKPATVIAALARRAGIEAFVVLYTLADSANPYAPSWRDISHFRVRGVAPSPLRTWWRYSPAEYAQFLLQLRQVATGRLPEPIPTALSGCVGICAGCHTRTPVELLAWGRCPSCGTTVWGSEAG